MKYLVFSITIVLYKKEKLVRFIILITIIIFIIVIALLTWLYFGYLASEKTDPSTVVIIVIGEIVGVSIGILMLLKRRKSKKV